LVVLTDIAQPDREVARRLGQVGKKPVLVGLGELPVDARARGDGFQRTVTIAKIATGVGEVAER
jgi:hypothetical protein